MGRPTDAERREVAGRLRELVAGGRDASVFNLAIALGMYAGGISSWVSNESVGHLAYLIDRPECRMRYDAAHADFVCSACGCLFEHPSTFWHGKTRGFRYCPTCGAEVVDGQRRSNEG